MEIKFTKYQGTGNDFVILDNREGKYNNLQVDQICDRRFGIGADGLMLLENQANYDFKMVYYNSDGAISSMCGNGGRCLVHFAHNLLGFQDECSFLAVDGEHTGRIQGDQVSLKMSNVESLMQRANACVLDTGSPHYIKFVAEMPSENFVSEAKEIRLSEEFREEGINVNFIKVTDNLIEIRTFERGVEGETLSCGTGVTAAAIAAHAENNKKTGDHLYHIDSSGGKLKVKFNFSNNIYSNVWLIGPAKKVFTGVI